MQNSQNSLRQRTAWWLPGVGVGGGELVLNGCRVSIWGDENILEISGSDSCMKYHVLNATEVHL
jgi:hypothetical protein